MLKKVKLTTPTKKATSKKPSFIRVNLSVNVIDSHLANIINKETDPHSYSANAKIENARPIFKKDERTK